MSKQVQEKDEKTSAPKEATKGRMVAERLAESVAPSIAAAISAGNVMFVGLTVVVDGKYSTTFPFHGFSKDDKGEVIPQDAFDAAKSIALAAIEYARTSGILKARCIETLESISE